MLWLDRLQEQRDELTHRTRLMTWTLPPGPLLFMCNQARVRVSVQEGADASRCRAGETVLLSTAPVGLHQEEKHKLSLVFIAAASI